MSGSIKITYQGATKGKTVKTPDVIPVAGSSKVKSIILSTGKTGPPGPPGLPGSPGSPGAPGQGVPTGGTAGQILVKIDNTDYNTQWSTAAPGGVTSFNSRTGAVSLLSSDVTGALGFTPYDASNPAGYISTISGITAGGELSGTYVNPSLLNSAVIAKVLTGLNIAGGNILASDSILTAFGKLQNQISGLLGGATYQGTWNATTNTPTLATGVGTKGFYYVVSVAGATNLNGITDWQVGDWAIYNGTAWQKVDNTDAVSSVNGFVGAVSLTTANISEVTNLYYTNARGIGSVLTGYTSGAGVVAATDTILQAIQKLNGNIGAIVGGVSSVFTRTGAVTAQSGDYNSSQVTENTNLYYTNARGIGSVLTGYVSGTGVVAATDTILQAIQKLNGNIGAIVSGVSSVTGNANSTLSISPTTGNVIAGINLATANTWTGAIAVQKDALAATPVQGIMLVNTTPAVLNTVQVSPWLSMKGSVWNTAASGTSDSIEFRQYVFPVQNTTNPIPEWRLDYSKAGAAFANGLSFSTNGNQFRLYQSGSSTVYSTISTDANAFLSLGNNGGGGVNIALASGSTMRTGSTRSGAGTWLQFTSSGAAPSTGDNVQFNLNESATWSSGAGTYAAFLISSTINQTSTASGIAYGIRINPTLTSVTGEYRAIDISAGKVVLAPSVTARASLNIPGGTVPTSPVNGDVYGDSTHLYTRLAGVTYQLDQQSAVDVQTFIGTSGTWTKPARAKTVRVILVSAGGGGGAGRRGAAGTARVAGGGGGAGGWSTMDFQASDLAATVAVVGGVGGTGGTASTVDNTSGNDGTAGTKSSFGAMLMANSGDKGTGGGNGTSGNGGGGGTGLNMYNTTVMNGGNADTAGGGGGNSNNAFMSSVGGAAGGGITAANVNSGIGLSGNMGGFSNPSNNYGSGFTSGGDGVRCDGLLFGTGGNGGGPSQVAAATKGGNGALYGAGGGGGGASLNGFNSGAGGNGGNGIVIVISYF